jgi:hypothetical protein
MSNILALHEVLYDTKGRSKTRVMLKLDFEKAYEKVHWSFLMRCLKKRGFGEKWCSWIESVLFNGVIAVKMNGMIGPYFQSYKWVRQGDPLPLLLFNIVVNYLTRMVSYAQ